MDNLEERLIQTLADSKMSVIIPEGITFNQHISNIERQASGMSIESVNDKNGYEVIDRLRKDIRELRSEVYKYLEALRKTLNVQRDQLITIVNHINRLDTIISGLADKQKTIDDEKDRIIREV